MHVQRSLKAILSVRPTVRCVLYLSSSIVREQQAFVSQPQTHSDGTHVRLVKVFLLRLFPQFLLQQYAISVLLDHSIARCLLCHCKGPDRPFPLDDCGQKCEHRITAEGHRTPLVVMHSRGFTYEFDIAAVILQDFAIQKESRAARWSQVGQTESPAEEEERMHVRAHQL